MTLIQLLVILLIIGVVLALVPVDPFYRKLSGIVAVIILVLVLLSYAGIF